MLDTLGKRVRILRLDLDMRQNDLESKLKEHGADIGQSYISVLENSDRIPSGEVVAALAKALGTTTDYLLLLTDNPLRPEDESGANISEDSEEILRLYDRLSPGRRRDLIRQADMWLREEDEDYLLELFRDLLDRYRAEGIEADAERIISDLLSRYDSDQPAA